MIFDEPVLVRTADGAARTLRPGAEIIDGVMVAGVTSDGVPVRFPIGSVVSIEDIITADETAYPEPVPPVATGPAPVLPDLLVDRSGPEFDPPTLTSAADAAMVPDPLDALFNPTPGPDPDEGAPSRDRGNRVGQVVEVAL